MPYCRTGRRQPPDNAFQKGTAVEPSQTDNTGQTDDLVTDTLVEEVSIDGMCGVY